MTPPNLATRPAHERRAGLPRRATDVDLGDAEELRRGVVESERKHIARELHDGLLNALTGATLQLELASRLVEQDPQAAGAHVGEIARMIADQQRELREWIRDMRQGRDGFRPTRMELLPALKAFCRHASLCGPFVELTGSDFALIPRPLADHVYRLVEESVSNSVRHAHPDTVRVDVRIWRNDVVITVEDDGRGFPFHGRYDLATLCARRLGPASVKERVTLLDGRLVLLSKRSGSRLEIRLPLAKHPRRPIHARSIDDAHAASALSGPSHADPHRPRR